MIRILVFITLICVTNSAVRDFVRNGKGGSSVRRPIGGSSWPSKLCENGSLGQLVRTQMREVIRTLEINGSYDKVLARFSQSIAYIKSERNTVILLSDCIEYYNGLNTARKFDRKAQELQESYQENANRLLRQILFPIISSFGFNFLT